MRQILHIFRKDLRHFWLEALCSWVILVAFAIVYPVQWLPNPAGFVLDGRTFNMQGLAGVITGLVPLAWFLLIVRLFQDENPVSQRSYWLTKPYEWPKLLAAKLLFLVVFLYLPFAIAQAALLKEAGFTVIPHLQGIVVNLLLNTIILILPCICLAVITPSFWKACLSILMLAGALIGLALVSTEAGTPVSIPFSDEVSPFIVFAVGITVVFNQYATRIIWVSRALIVATFISITITALNPFERVMLEHVYYPLASGVNPIPVEIAFSPPSNQISSVRNEDDQHVALELPLAIDGVPYGVTVEPNDVRLRILASDGQRWIAPWHSIDNRSYTSQTKHASVSILVDRSFLARIRNQPVDLELELALTESEAGQSRSFTMPASGSLSIPGFGICDIEEVPESFNPNLHCRYALSMPSRTVLTAFVTPQPCPESGAAPMRSYPETVSTGSFQADPEDFGITSVWETQLGFSYGDDSDANLHQGPKAHLCPGTSISVVPYHLVRRSRYVVRSSGMHLPPAPSLHH